MSGFPARRSEPRVHPNRRRDSGPVDVGTLGGDSLQQVEIDYPSASFGVGNLAPNSQFHYRFKIQGSGPVKLEYTDAQGKTHTVDGPELTEGQEGSLTVAIDSTGKVTWNPNFTKTP